VARDPENASAPRPNLKDHGREALREHFSRDGLPAYRADQVLSWLYGRGVDDIEAMTDLPAQLRDSLASTWDSRALEIGDVQVSQDGTRKIVLRTRDGEVLESVLIPEERRNTLCVSTQVGCPLACSFCATGKMGMIRNLTVAEIVDQLMRAREVLPEGDLISNIVFMGMGEPLLNLAAVKESIRIFTDPRCLAMAPRRITVSTSGVVPQIRPLLEIGPINLAVSLHATTDEVRDELVPLNKRFPLDTLLGALRDEELISRKRPVFFEYTLMAGTNDSLEDARRLPRLLEGIPGKVNLIPMNPHPDASYQPPSQEVCDAFAAEVHASGLRVTLRRNRGRDIDAACGQLAARGQTRGSAPAAQSRD
jgi:23S rRNA (adenine2503-C2)-methyltransferase